MCMFVFFFAFSLLLVSIKRSLNLCFILFICSLSILFSCLVCLIQSQKHILFYFFVTFIFFTQENPHTTEKPQYETKKMNNEDIKIKWTRARKSTPRTRCCFGLFGGEFHIQFVLFSYMSFHRPGTDVCLNRLLFYNWMLAGVHLTIETCMKIHWHRFFALKHHSYKLKLNRIAAIATNHRKEMPIASLYSTLSVVSTCSCEIACVCLCVCVRLCVCVFHMFHFSFFTSSFRVLAWITTWFEAGNSNALQSKQPIYVKKPPIAYAYRPTK